MSQLAYIFVVVMSGRVWSFPKLSVPVARPVSVHGFLKQLYEGGWKDGQRKYKPQNSGRKA